MKLAIASAAALSLMAGAALAQTSSSNSTSANSPSAAQATTAQKIKTDLQNSGFQDVNVTAESFFVQAKTKDGDPVMMTIGPHGMSMIEAVGGKSSSSGSNSSSNTGSSSATTK